MAELKVYKWVSHDIYKSSGEAALTLGFYSHDDGPWHLGLNCMTFGDGKPMGQSLNLFRELRPTFWEELSFVPVATSAVPEEIARQSPCEPGDWFMAEASLTELPPVPKLPLLTRFKNWVATANFPLPRI